jgi:hypothetical protein
MMEKIGKSAAPNFIDDMLLDVLQLISHPSRSVSWGFNGWLDNDVAWLQHGFLSMCRFRSEIQNMYDKACACMTIKYFGKLPLADCFFMLNAC